MRERPILFSAPMVRAILEGRKVQTRRVVKPQPKVAQLLTHSGWSAWHDEKGQPLRNRYGQPGDRLWVRETFARWTARELFSGRPIPTLSFRAGRPVLRLPDDAPFLLPLEQWDRGWDDDLKPADVRWRPSIHMPRAASRITLEITDVRVQRLQECSEADAIAEGIERDDEGRWTDYLCQGFGGYFDHPAQGARLSYASLWDAINGAGAWNANPWVWALTFRRVAP